MATKRSNARANTRDLVATALDALAARVGAAQEDVDDPESAGGLQQLALSWRALTADEREQLAGYLAPATTTPARGTRQAAKRPARRAAKRPAKLAVKAEPTPVLEAAAPAKTSKDEKKKTKKDDRRKDKKRDEKRDKKSKKKDKKKKHK